MNCLTVLKFGTSERLDKMLASSLSKYEHIIISNVDDMYDLQNKKILFAIELGDTGINIGHMKMLSKIMTSGSDFMKSSVGGIIISSDNELFSRSIARKTIFYANMAGCMFPGKPLSEATGSLRNFRTQQAITAGN